jgi:hypothetical protein
MQHFSTTREGVVKMEYTTKQGNKISKSTFTLVQAELILATKEPVSQDLVLAICDLFTSFDVNQIKKAVELA